MAAVSQVDAVITALITALTTAGLVVLDGTDEPRGDDPGTFVIVGGDGDPLGSGRPAAIATQAPGVFGGAGVDESPGVVTCAVISNSGDDQLATCRANSLTAYTTVEATLRADPTLGGVVGDGYVDGMQLFQRRTRGAHVRRVFTYRFVVYG
jgi:hypothetical protein